MLNRMSHSKTEVSLSNNSNENTYLRTLKVVKIKRKSIRALIDSGSQHSYVGEMVIWVLRVDSNREKNIHCLFGEK